MPGKKTNNSTTLKAVPLSLALILCVMSFCDIALSQISAEHLFSETVGLQFYNIAHELVQSKQAMDSTELAATGKEISSSELNQALLFLYATTLIDTRSNYVLPDMLGIATRLEPSSQKKATAMGFVQDNRVLAYQLLQSYTNKSSDFFVLRETIENLLDRLDSREEREQFIQTLLASDLRGKNSRFDSYLATLLGLYSAEKPDLQGAAAYLMEAYNLDNYNHLAFSKLAEIAAEQIQPVFYLKQLRLKLVENPLDLAAALDFAQFAQTLELYDIAADGYAYCADLFAYLYPSEVLPPSIYLPWSISCYNTERSQYKAVQVADVVRESGRFDLMLEAIAAKAAEKIGDGQKANQLFQAAEKTALRGYMENPYPVMAERFAWFYSFANTEPFNALDWANKAFSKDPNSTAAASLLAYTLVENGQAEWAQTIIDNYPSNQIMDLTLAKIAIEQENTESAIEHLNSAIEKDPSSFEAELAKQLLVQQGGQYIPDIDAEFTFQTLQGELKVSVVPQFIAPQNIISVNINTRGSKFSYGSGFDGYLVITNNSSEPIIISDHSLFKGNVRVDATITGDITKIIPNLITKRVLPSSPIQPNRNLLIPLQFSTGQLKDILKTYPQASLEIEFTAYIDPVTDIEGNLSNNLRDIAPATTMVTRPGVELTRRYLQNRFDSMGTGRQGQKLQTVQLFIGLLQEQKAMANQPPLYKFMYADWMPELLKSALIETLSDRDWVVKSNTMAEMLPLDMDYELTSAVSENLNDTHWPVRSIALYLLAKKQGSKFINVLDWYAEHDQEQIVRNMAIALGGKEPAPTSPPEPQQVPQEQTTLERYMENMLNRTREVGPTRLAPSEPQQAP